MADFQRNFIKGRMNKSVDERLVPNGEYIHAQNVRLGSTEISEIGAVENSRGNLQLTRLSYGGRFLSGNATVIGALEDGANEELYWFVHDPTFAPAADGPEETPTGILDLVVSYNTNTSAITYHIISVSIDGNPNNGTTLNFNPTYLITGVNIIDGLLFWTDDFNPPRKINVRRNYPDPVAAGVADPNIDGGTGEPEGGFLLQESILVIKRPPVACPGLELSLAPGEENYLEDRFISFAYRYKYQDNEYSAISQFTEVAFQTESFDFSPNSKVNEGAINRFNTATITYNSGSPLVVGIDLLFKESVSNVIKVIETLDKDTLGLASDTEYEYVFRNAKIFTVLPESELLRLYDNVPRLAQAQTLMGNRLMFGNYVDGYDLIDINDAPVRLEYINELISQEIGLTEVTDRTDTVDYTVDVPITVNEGQLLINLANAELTAGALLTFAVTFEHDTFSGGPPNPVETSSNFSVEFQYLIPQDFATVFDLATSVNFQEAIGVPAEILPVYDPVNPTSCEGVTLTDVFNCAVPDVLDAGLTPSWTKFQSGISAYGQPIAIVTSPGSSEIGFEFLAMERVDDVAAPVDRVVEYFSIVTAEATYQEIGNTQSLHSDRDYEVGIIYMDEFNRASTALVSPNNTVHIPCEFSDNQNSLRVTIPSTQRPPYWATRFKFCIKPSAAGFFTVFSRIFFTDPVTNYQYFLLEGENSQKVEEGDRLKVKRDASGPVDRCLYATVLEKAAQERDFIEIPSEDDPNQNIPVPAGTYMKLKANFNVNNEENQIIAPGEVTVNQQFQPVLLFDVDQRQFARMFYGNAFSLEDSANPNLFVDVDIPVGSRIKLNIYWNRRGRGGTSCERRRYILDLDLISSQNYDNIIDWWNGDNVDQLINTGEDETAANGPPIVNQYISTVYTTKLDTAINIPAEFAINKLAWTRIAATNEILFFVTGAKQCAGGRTDRNKSFITVEWEIVRATSEIIWETEPSDASPSLWFEGSQSFRVTSLGQCYLSVENNNAFDIEYLYELDGFDRTIVIPANTTIDNILITCGTAQESPATPTTPGTTVVIETNVLPPAHTGNVQSQVIATNTPAIIDLDFFNCFAFGNGVETIRVRDSIKGRELALGDRFTSVANVDYKEANRFADITYSGIFNDESNINKLNEFNLALLNFKTLEESYGPIQKLDARSTDILTLQEDKISYVLAGKNLLSDAAVGGAITSVPEVLGTQIARLEEYGISANPESYTQYGYNKFFSDQKRGAVLMLKGSAYTNEQLMVISESGMRSWFRDVFIETPNTQKLGGYDPYMDEYVFAINNNLLPLEIPCVDCGVQQQIEYRGPINFCYDVGQLVGDVTVSIRVTNFSGSGVDPITFTFTYNGLVFVQDAFANGTYTVTIPKNSVVQDTIDLLITGVPSARITIEVSCPDAEEITIYQVCVSADANATEFIHNEYRWVDGAYISPLHSTEVELASGTDNPLISQFDSITGPQGAGVIPADGAVVTIRSNKIAPADNFDFVTPPMTFRFLRTNDVYANTPASVATLLSNATVGAVDSSLAPTQYSASFVMPATGSNLFLIYDYRQPTLVELCYGNIDIFDVCCLCEAPERFVATQCRLDGVVNTEVVEGPYAIGEFVEIDTSLDGIKIETCIYELTANTTDIATALVTGLSAITDCTDLCQKYTVENTGGVAQDVEYVNCGGVNETATVQPGTTLDAICAKEIVSLGADLVLDLKACACDDQYIEIERCVDPQSTGGDLIRYANDNLTYNVNDVVFIDEDPTCQYIVTQIGLYNQIVDATVNSVDLSLDCTDACNTYEVTNNGVGDLSVEYRECGKNTTDTVIIPQGDSTIICTREFITSITFPNTVVWQACDCDLPDSNYRLRECTQDGTINEVVASYSGFGTVQVGDYVEISGSLCIWEVIAETQDVATDIITQIRGDVTSCDDSCDTYTLENLSTTVTYTVNYLDCAGVQQSVTISPTGVQSVCATLFLGPPVDVDIVKSFCGCQV